MGGGLRGIPRQPRRRGRRWVGRGFGVACGSPTPSSDPVPRAAGGATGDMPPRAHRPFSRPAREAPAAARAGGGGVSGARGRALVPSAGRPHPIAGSVLPRPEV